MMDKESPVGLPIFSSVAYIGIWRLSPSLHFQVFGNMGSMPYNFPIFQGPGTLVKMGNTHIKQYEEYEFCFSLYFPRAQGNVTVRILGI